MKKQVQDLLSAINSSTNFFKYPIGNAGLAEKLKHFEALKKITFNSQTMQWQRGKK